MPLPGVEAEPPKFEQDFIILSEFSEQVGPVPIQIIPEDGCGTFDVSHFSVRIMSSDFQSASENFAVSEDSQVILTESRDKAYAYVHYFCLNDIHARGYVRQYCLSFITSSLEKLTDHFEDLLQRFSEVTAVLKCGNHRIFGKDLEHQLADLEHTLWVLEDEGWEEGDEDEPLERYEGFDFGSENVPERDPSVVRHSIQETKSIMESMKEEQSLEHNQKMYVYLETQKKAFRHLQHWKQPALPEGSRMEGNFMSYVPRSFVSTQVDGTLHSVSSELSSSGEASVYKPQRVMAHLVHKFDRRLRPMEELSSKLAHRVAMEKLKQIHKLYSRSNVCLTMEKIDAQLLDPYSSLLSIGRVPQLNMLLGCRLDGGEGHTLLDPSPYQLSCVNTWGQPIECPEASAAEEGCPEFVEGAFSGFNTEFLMDARALFKWPLYLDVSTDPRRRRRSTFSSESFGLLSPDSSLMTPGDGGMHETRPTGTTQHALTLEQSQENMSRASTAYNTPQGRTPEKERVSPLSPGERKEGEEEREREGGGGRTMMLCGYYMYAYHYPRCQ